MFAPRITLAVAATLLLLPGITATQAQTPAAPPAAIPEQMPFDIPYGPAIDLEMAQKTIAAAVAEAKKHNWKHAVAVVGPSGDLIALATMDGTQYASIGIAEAKARTAAIFRRPSKVFESVINTGGGPGALSLLAEVHGVASEGGLPIVIGGKLVGAIGASGGISTQDGAVAQAGLAAVATH